jgi:hypothetical protein
MKTVTSIENTQGFDVRSFCGLTNVPPRNVLPSVRPEERIAFSILVIDALKEIPNPPFDNLDALSHRVWERVRRASIGERPVEKLLALDGSVPVANIRYFLTVFTAMRQRRADLEAGLAAITAALGDAR